MTLRASREDPTGPDVDGASFVVNGQPVTVALDPDTPLVTVLRNDLGLWGVRTGCSQGFCGSCTVLADGEPIASCTTPLSEIEGRRITTPEGLGTPDAPDPVQAAFIDEQAAQCGYCINGMIMRTAAAAAAGTVPTPQQLDENHLCRCGTHSRILRALARSCGAGPDSAEPADSGAALATAASLPPAVDQLTLPSHGTDPQRIEAWLQLLPDGRVAALTGRVELGQGIRGALGRIVAAHIGIAAHLVTVVATTTALSVDEGYTAGSNSIDTGGSALATAAVGFARALRHRAAQLLEVDVTTVTIREDGHVGCDTGTLSFAEVAASGPITGDLRDDDRPDWHRLQATTSRPSRDDLRYKLTGAPAFVHDLALAHMLHARALLPPSYEAELVQLDVDGAEALPGVVRVLVDGRLIVVIAEREEQAVRAVRRLERDVRWTSPDLAADARSIADHYRQLEAETYVAAAAQQPGSTPTHQATFTVTYQAHAAVAPSCAVAHETDDGLLVHTHSQGVYPLRRSLAALLDLDADQLTVTHGDGPGCYGHNLADDAAAVAAVAARAVPGRPVRFQFSSEDEFTWEPFGPAMVIDLAAWLGADGRVGHWRHRGVSDVHTTRPQGHADRLVVSWLRADALARPWPGPHEGGARNAVPLYRVPADAAVDHVRGPLRTSALRTLGAFANTFAGECFMDELAERAGCDPVEFRLAHLDDQRAASVLRMAADAVAWVPRVGPSGRGRGIALSRYKDQKAYVAAVADVTVDPDTARIGVERVLLACDAGAIVDADGLRNQLEGGALQGLSRTLREEVRFDRRGITSRDWSTYPVIGFGDLPDIGVVLVQGSPHPPLGVGEAALGPVAAAVANGVDDALGVRLRQLPLTPDRVTQRFHSLDEHEAARVLLD